MTAIVRALEEPEVYRAAVVAAWRLTIEDALRSVARWQGNKLRQAAVSRERLRTALDSIIAHPEAMIPVVEPALRMWAALAGEADPPEVARAEAAQLVAEYVDESARQVTALLAAPWSGNDAAPMALDKILDRWRDRGPRIAERLARRLEESQ